MKKLLSGNAVGEIFDVHAKTLDDLGYKESRMNACGYSLGATFSPTWMDVPPYDLHWKPINYKTWDGIFYAHDIDGFKKSTRYEFGRDLPYYRK